MPNYVYLVVIFNTTTMMFPTFTKCNSLLQLGIQSVWFFCLSNYISLWKSMKLVNQYQKVSYIFVEESGGSQLLHQDNNQGIFHHSLHQVSQILCNRKLIVVNHTS